MFQMFYPDEYVESTYSIDFQSLYEQGIRGVLFDIDNTLVEHGADASDRAKELFHRLKEMGLNSCLISNNQIERVERFNRDIHTNYIYNAHKPAKKNYWKAMKIMKTNLDSTIFVGDQLFTDVYGAKRIGMKNILVKPIGKKEEIQIVFKRYLERIVLNEYRRKNRRQSGRRR